MNTFFPDDLLHDAEALLSELQRRSLSLAIAESCTGGLVCGLLTEIPGSSAVLERGFVTYSNAAKSELLGIDPVLITRHGAVSEEVARAMAEGAAARATVDIAISVTGDSPNATTAARNGELVSLVTTGSRRWPEPAGRRSPT